MSSTRWTNWNRNFVSRPERLYRPTTVHEVAEIVRSARKSGRTVRAVGSGYSYTPLVDTSHDMVSLDALNDVYSVDLEGGLAKVGAGITLNALTKALASHGAALDNMGDIDRQTLAGAIATGTHGTGLGFGSLSSQVIGMTLIDGRGELVHLDAANEPALFKAAQVSLGALGIVVDVTMRVVPIYALAKECMVAEFDEVVDRIDQEVSNSRNFEFFWYPNGGWAYVKRMNRVPLSKEPNAAETAMRWVDGVVIENGVVWLSAVSTLICPLLRAPWLRAGRHLAPSGTRVLPAHQAYATPRLVLHHETEYALPIASARKALTALAALHQRFPARTMIPIEFRFTGADDIPLSMSEGGDVMYVAVHAYRHEDPSPYFARCEDLFAEFGGRPHWGKMHRLEAAELARLYPRWAEFQSAQRTLDPDGVFSNSYLRRVLGIP